MARIEDPVRAQYEALPYPARDPADEARRLVTGSPSDLREIEHYVFAGRLDPAAPFRALVAGCGTGDAAIMLGQQLGDAGFRDARVDCIDLSDASLAVARSRADARGLTHLTFARGSLLEAEPAGPYDYIDCCGVLHHLDDPPAGIAALARRLAPTGGMGLMVYGTLGRSGVYDVQDALTLLTGDAVVPQRLKAARALLGDLPPGNRLIRNPVVGDHKGGADADLYDLLCHKVDRSYLVPEVLDLLDGAGLAPAGWIEPARYDPMTWLRDETLRKRAAKLGPREAAALAELLAGTFKKHTLYAAPRARAAAAAAAFPAPGKAADTTVVPKGTDMGALAAAARAGQTPHIPLDGVRVPIPLEPAAADALARIDGRRRIAELVPDSDPARTAKLLRRTIGALVGANLACLRFPGGRG